MDKDKTAIEMFCETVMDMIHESQHLELLEKYENALTLEREQIINAYIESYKEQYVSEPPFPTEDAEQYYTTKYGKQ